MKIETALSTWLRCTRCPLHRFRRHVVLGRGRAPARVLLIGEAPGRSEDLIGAAFVGRAGRLLDAALEEAARLAACGPVPSFYVTNVLGCIPKDTLGGEFRPPKREEEFACWPRLEHTARLVDAERVVLLGTVAAESCGAQFPDALHLRHPAYILRRGGLASTEYRTFVRELCDLFKPEPPARLVAKDVFGCPLLREPRRRKE